MSGHFLPLSPPPALCSGSHPSSSSTGDESFKHCQLSTVIEFLKRIDTKQKEEVKMRVTFQDTKNFNTDVSEIIKRIKNFNDFEKKSEL